MVPAGTGWKLSARKVRCGGAKVRILLLGKSGQVGWELQRALAPLGMLTSLGRDEVDLENPAALREAIQQLRPDVIANAAAYTAVDKAEADPQRAERINAEAPAIMAEEASKLDALLVHYSTDYVFNGQNSAPWREDDLPAPINVYGVSKYRGEQAIRQIGGCRHLIFRTSWVFASRGHNFLSTMVRLMRERDSLKVVGDQVGAPTSAELIADVTAHAVMQVRHAPEKCGLYHLVSAGETSWHGYATYIAELLQQHGGKSQVTPERIQAIPSDAYPVPAKRPANSRLSTQKLEQTFGLRMPSWEQGVARALDELMFKITE